MHRTIGIEQQRLKDFSAGKSLTTLPGSQLFQAMAHVSTIIKRFRHVKDFWQVLSEIGSMLGVTDAREIIYSAVGLLNDDQLDITPDYTLGLNEVLIQTTAAFLHGKGDLQILSYLPRSQRGGEPLPRTG
jgi:hypothetical protein